jgi:sugar phosphate isomerase/epimerase
MKLSFMTFVCPEWDMETAVRFARDANYDGIEIRVDAGHQHNVSSQSTAEERRAVKALFADQGVEVSSVATSVLLAYPDQTLHREHMAAGKANLDLAADLGAPVVRIFAGGGIPALTDAAAAQIAAALDELGEYSQGTGTCPVLECGHDIMVGAAEIARVLPQVTTSNFGALWNYSVMDDETFAAIKDDIRHFHFHDEVRDPQNMNFVSLARRMKSIGYQGYVSLEIIEEHNLPEAELRDIAARVQAQIKQGESG